MYRCIHTFALPVAAILAKIAANNYAYKQMDLLIALCRNFVKHNVKKQARLLSVGMHVHEVAPIFIGTHNISNPQHFYTCNITESVAGVAALS